MIEYFTSYDFHVLLIKIVIVFGGVNTLRGDAGNDAIFAGDSGIDDIAGGAGNDLIQASVEPQMRGRLADLLTQDHGNGFGVNETMRRLEVLKHSIRVHFQTCDGFGDPMQRAGAQAKQLGQSFPFGMPSAKSSFVLLHHGRHDGGLLQYKFSAVAVELNAAQMAT